MPPRDSADTFDTGIALRNNRGLDLRWPVPPLAFAREDLEPLRALAHRIITRDYHRSSALSPNQVAQTPRWASPTQGGGRTAHTLSPATFYKLKAKYGGLELSDARRLRQLEDENGKLKRLLAESVLDNAILKDLLGKV